MSELKPGVMPVSGKNDSRDAALLAVMGLPGAVLLGSLVACSLSTLRFSLLPSLGLSGAIVLIGFAGELLIHWKFGNPRARNLADIIAAPAIGEKGHEHALDTWKHIVDVQMHFNDMLMRTRNYALTLVLAILGGAGVAVERLATIKIGLNHPGPISLASVLLLAGVVGLFAFYFLDRFYYHPLLVASVMKGTEVENWLFATNPGVDLTGVISFYSRTVLWEGGAKNARKLRLYARNKLTWFYFGLAVLLSILAFVVRDVGLPANSVKKSPTKSPVLCTARRASDSVVVWMTPACGPDGKLIPAAALP